VLTFPLKATENVIVIGIPYVKICQILSESLSMVYKRPNKKNYEHVYKTCSTNAHQVPVHVIEGS